MRYERKFRLENIPHSQVLQVIKDHPFGFTSPFPERVVNNIYFDTPDLKFAVDNQAGVARRQKIRIRWYGHVMGGSLRLEYKMKEGFLGFKKVESIAVPPGTTLATLSKRLTDATGQLLRPTLQNNYRRYYFATRNGKFRMTVDDHQQFGSLLQKSSHTTLLALNEMQSKSSGWLRDEAVIIELKYAADAEIAAGEVMQFIPFRLSKNSKYVIGLEKFLI